METIHEAVVCESLNVNATVELSPSNVSEAMVVNVTAPTDSQPSALEYCSSESVVVLNHNIPTTPVPGRCDCLLYTSDAADE